MSVSLQKANLWKRISAWMFDCILVAILAIGAASGISEIVAYDKYSDQLTQYHVQAYQEEGIEKYIGITQEDFDALPDEEKAKINQAESEYAKNENVQNITRRQFYLTLVIIGGGLLIAHMLWNFAIPLFFGNGQTLGKKIFGTALMRSNCVKITTPILFIRTLFGKYVMETMFPVLILMMILFMGLGSVGLTTLILFAILQLGVIVMTQTNSAIHDLVADTVVVDFASQMIFDSEEQMIAFKEEQARSAAERENNKLY